MLGNVIKFWSENLKGRDNLEELDTNGRIVLELILSKYKAYCKTKFKFNCSEAFSITSLFRVLT